MRSTATLLFAILAAVPSQASPAELPRADTLWELRAEGQREGHARPERTGAAIEAYAAAIAAQPESLEAHWKLLRALWFSADFATDQVAEERRLYERARALSENAFEILAERVGGADALANATPDEIRERLPAASRRDAAELYFWYAVNLGALSRVAGLFQAVRTGAANRLHNATLRSIAIDPDVEQGGAIRLLSRLHSELPRVPVISGWVDPELAVPLAERALAEYPHHPGNSYLLGLALLSHSPERRAEGLHLIEATAELEPRADHVVEDLAIRADARERLLREAHRG